MSKQMNDSQLISPPAVEPLLPTDPPKVGDFWLDGRLVSYPSGTAFLSHNEEHPSLMLLLLSDGAATDAAARDRFSGEINKLHIDTVVARGGQDQDQGRLGGRFRDESDDPIGPNDAPLAPWAALLFDGSPAAYAEANRILGYVSLDSVRSLGKTAGPDFRLHWVDNSSPGMWRLWPLPWPGRKDRTGWVPTMVSWLMMIILALLGLLIAVLLFQQPDPPPPPDQQSQGGGGGTSTETMPGEPTPPPSDSPSMRTLEPTGTESGGGSPTENERL